jgi:hypothetical protein
MLWDAAQARYHPGFRTANLHTCLDQAALDAGAPFSYFNFSVFEAAEEVNSLEELSSPHSDWMTSMEFGHDGQVHHPIVVRCASIILTLFVAHSSRVAYSVPIYIRYKCR